MKKQSTAKRINLKFPQESEWLYEALEKERQKQNRSMNNMVTHILLQYFKKGKK